jgi:hypothetical protein
MRTSPEKYRRYILLCVVVIACSTARVTAQEQPPAAQNTPADDKIGAVESPVVRGLKKRVTLKIDRVFEGAVDELSKQINVPIKVIDLDIANEGIVPQSHLIRLAVEDQPAVDVLLEMIRILQRGRSDNVVYVIKPRAPGEPDMIFITTRMNASKRGDKVPAVFDRPATVK